MCIYKIFYNVKPLRYKISINCQLSSFYQINPYFASQELRFLRLLAMIH